LSFDFGDPGAGTGNWTSFAGWQLSCGANGSNPTLSTTHLYCFETTLAGPVSAGTPAIEVPTIPPDGLLAFVTDATSWFPGINQGLPGADSKCTNAGLSWTGRTFAALLTSGSAGALSRITVNGTDGPWYRPDGVQVARTSTDLLNGTLLAPISLNGNATPIPQIALSPESADAWTGGSLDSAQGQTCTNWTSSSGTAYSTMGHFFDSGPLFFTSSPYDVVHSVSTSPWDYGAISPGNFPCSNQGRLYCLEHK
jgi:hypothetical protein